LIPRFLPLLLLAVFAPLSASASARVVTYPAPKGASLNERDFSVRVRAPGGEWQPVAIYRVMVAKVVGHDYGKAESSMACFDFDGRVEVEVTSHRDIESSRVRPLSYGIKPATKGHVLTFTLDRPRNLSVEVNGDIFRNLHLFANPIETSRPKSGDPNVISFGPGLHVLPADDRGRRVLRVPSGKTVYLAGGAIVRGRISIDGAENARVIGRGMVEQTASNGDSVSITRSRNITVEGIFATKCFTGGSENVRITNVKCISYLPWGDGMNVISSSDVAIDGVFNRNSDDCITVYGTRSGFHGGARNITVQNSTLWADIAHPILVGTHGSTPKPETLENLAFRNIDILDHNEAQIDYQGCLALNAGDSNLIRNVLFENIRIEDFRVGQLVNLRVFFNRKYCTSPGRGIEDVTLRNITYAGRNAALSIICGYDETRTVKNVVFENLVINGARISDRMNKPGWFKTSDMAGIYVGEHVDGILFE
jgi:hypothetical protein